MGTLPGKSKLSQITALIQELESEAYQRGWDAAAAQIMAVAKSGLPAAQPKPKVDRPLPLPQPQLRPSKPLIDIVSEMVRTMPGLRGTAIVDSVAKIRPGKNRKSLDRTTRTALMRLKKRGKIESRNGGWFPKEAQAA